MHLLFLLPTRFLSVAKITGKKSCTWLNGALPHTRSQHGKWSVLHLAQKANRRFWCEKDSWFFLFLHYTLFLKNVVVRTFFDGCTVSLLFVAMVYGYIGRMLLPCGNGPKGMLDFRTSISTSSLPLSHSHRFSFAVDPLVDIACMSIFAFQRYFRFYVHPEYLPTLRFRASMYFGIGGLVIAIGNWTLEI